jgi:hypothetical protein
MVTQQQADDDLGLRAHLVAEANLEFFRAEKITVLFGRAGDDKYRKLCQLTFNKKSGALYAQFTYFRTDPGVVGLVTTEIGQHGESTISWTEGGKIATSLVKYSHPPDGKAHFSQDGAHRTQFWSQSLNLHRDEGNLFEIHAFYLEPFEQLLKADVTRKGRLLLPFQADGLPNGVTVVAEWRSLQSVRAYAAELGRVIGPVADLPRNRDQALFKAALVAPPAQSPLADHVLLVSVVPAVPPASTVSPALFFMGGWQLHDTFAAGTSASFLSFTYPIENADELARTLGSADL